MLKDILNLEQKEMIEQLNDMHGYDMAQSFTELDPEDKDILIANISDDKLAELVSYLEVEEGALVLQTFDLRKQKELVENMEPDDAVDIILELDKSDRKDLLSILDESSDVLSLMSYDEDETGSAMTNLIITLTPEMDVKQATKKVIKEASNVESISTLFVVDEENHYLGIVKLKKLLKAKIPLTVAEITEDQPYAYSDDPISETISKIRNYAIYSIPVVDDDKLLLGIVTLDDALDIYEDEAQKDFERLSALPGTVERNAFDTAMHRIPWLIMLIVISIPISFITSRFEEILTAVAILIIFQPLIADSAGNVATQTLAVTLKMFSKNEKGMLKNSLREILTGLINGFVIGLVAFIVTFVFSSFNTTLSNMALNLAFVVGLTLWGTMLLASGVAIIVPITLQRLRLDPAVASGPFITTIMDIFTITAYFSLATLMLGGI